MNGLCVEMLSTDEREVLKEEVSNARDDSFYKLLEEGKGAVPERWRTLFETLLSARKKRA